MIPPVDTPRPGRGRSGAASSAPPGARAQSGWSETRQSLYFIVSTYPQPPISRQRCPDAASDRAMPEPLRSRARLRQLAGVVPGLLRIGPMKKGGILNPAICSLLAELGQSDELLDRRCRLSPADRRPRHRPDPHPRHPPPAGLVRAVAEELVDRRHRRPGRDQGIQPPDLPGDPQDPRRHRRRRGPVPRVQGTVPRRQGDHPHRRVQPVRQRPDRRRQRVLKPAWPVSRRISRSRLPNRTGIRSPTCP